MSIEKTLSEVRRKLPAGCPHCGCPVLHFHLDTAEVTDGIFAIDGDFINAANPVIGHQETVNEVLNLECTRCGQDIDLDDIEG
jgi:ribosomal protein S27AE